MHDVVDAAREAVEAYYAARTAAARIDPYQSASLGCSDALRAAQAHERALAAALEALAAVPYVGEAVGRYNRVTGYEWCDDTVGHLERLLVTGEVGQVLDDLCCGGAATLALTSDICL